MGKRFSQSRIQGRLSKPMCYLLIMHNHIKVDLIKVEICQEFDLCLLYRLNQLSKTVFNSRRHPCEK